MNKEELVKAIDESLFDLSLQIEEEFAECFLDMPEKYRFVLQLVSRYSPLYVKDLAELLRVSRSSVSQMLSKMESEGYIVRELDPEKRRQTFVKLGEKGKGVLQTMENTRNLISSKYLKQLRYEELERFYDIAVKLKAVVEEEREVPSSSPETKARHND